MSNYKNVLDYDSRHLTPELKSWIYFKIKSFYQQDVYFSNTHVSTLLITFKKILWCSDTLLSLFSQMEAEDIDNPINLSRKSADAESKSTLFQFPPLSLQILSILECWEEIKQMQDYSGENIDHAIEASLSLIPGDLDNPEWDHLDENRVCYGNKPNTYLNIPYLSSSWVLGDQQKNLIFPLNVDFRFEYNSFRRRIKNSCEHIAENIQADQEIVYIQTDIIKFFHNVNLMELSSFLRTFFPSCIKTRKFIEALMRLNYDSLPIGWILSKFLSNFLIQKFHVKAKKNLQRRIRLNLCPKTEGKDSIFYSVRLKGIFSYADDIVIIATAPISVSKNKEIVSGILKACDSVLKEVITSGSLHLHTNFPKLKTFTFNKNTVAAVRNILLSLRSISGDLRPKPVPTLS